MKKWQHRLHSIIYEADTFSGKLFDILLLIAIILSVLFVALESVTSINLVYNGFLNTAGWIVTVLFTIEYILRIVCVKRPWRYVFSFYGVIDLISTLPKYLSLFFVGTHSLVALKALPFLANRSFLFVTHKGYRTAAWKDRHRIADQYTKIISK